MKIALCSDEWHPINEYVQKLIIQMGYEVALFGSYLTKQDTNWVEATLGAAEAVSKSECNEGIFFCWSGTGAAIVANKVKNIRAALCNDPEITELARIWNHANVLVLSNRTCTESLAKEVINAWFKEYAPNIAANEIAMIKNYENERLQNNPKNNDNISNGRN